MDLDLDAPTATTELFQLYKNDMYRYVRFTLGSSLDAEDVVQEIFIKVLRNWDRFRGEASVKTWLWCIARNCITDRLRKKKREPLKKETDESWGKMGEDPSYKRLEIEEMLQDLPPNYREIIVLRILQNWSTEDSAHILGWSEAKVRTTLHRAIEKLRLLMSESDLLERRNQDVRRHS